MGKVLAHSPRRSPTRRCLRASAAALLVALASGCQARYAPLPVVQHVDLAKYTGRWFEIARYPNWFERGCTVATAEYTALPDGKIEVVNACHRDSPDGPVDMARARARVVDRETNAKLKVMFFWPLEGDYWILELGERYEYAVIGEPSRRYLWILSRTDRMEESVYADILSRLPALGYDPSRLERTIQRTTAIK